MESVVYNHFGSAPYFVVVDSATGAAAVVANSNQHHAHGACNPVQALGGERVDTVVVGGIGAGALAGLTRMGIVVRRAQAGTIRENLALLRAEQLPVIETRGCCSSHGHGGSCQH